VRAYRIDDQDALAFRNWDEFHKANTSESREWASRPIPKDEELAKYQPGMEWHARWEFPNPEHCTLDLLYDRYLLFGDQRAFENMRLVAGHGGFFAIGHAPSIHRNTGWSWRALERYWELTGDKRAEELLKEAIKAYAPLIGKAPLVCRGISSSTKDPNDIIWWFVQIWSRAVAMTALHTGDPQMLELAKTAAEGKEDKAYDFSTLFAVLYHLTGEEKYKGSVMKKTGDGRKLLSASGPDYFLPSDHWLLQQPPRTAPGGPRQDANKP
jgi:hypothetical protein